MSRHILWLIFLGLTACSRVAWAAPVWPEMREFALRVGISFVAHRNDIEVPLYDVDGVIRYRFICKGDDREVDELAAKRLREQGRKVEHNPYIAWWPLTCVLLPEGGKSNLLDSDGVNGPYQTRGKIDPQDLLEPCARYPEHGRIRHFRLRGFVLTISFSDITPSSEDPAVLEYALMHIAVRRDPTAFTAWAEPSGYMAPRRAQHVFGDPLCGKVRRSEEKRMCRNLSTLSWEPCQSGTEFEPAGDEIAPYAGMRANPDRERQRDERVRLWFVQMRPASMPNLIAKRLALIREAVRQKDGMILQKILPVFPFPLLCGQAGTSAWASLPVKNMKAWRDVWQALLKKPSFTDIGELADDGFFVSSNFGIWIRGGLLRLQEGLTIATSIPCDEIERLMD